VSFLRDNCTFCELTPELIDSCDAFSCEKDKDIEQFFKSEYAQYSSQLLGKSYCFITNVPGEEKIVCAFTVSNSSIKVDNLPSKKRNRLNRKIPNSKRKSQYPAVLVGQLAVFDEFHGSNIGTELMDFIKSWFIDPLNKTGCRYVIVDAVNHEKVLQYYQDNGFDFIFSSDEEEIKSMEHSERINIWKKLEYRFFHKKNSVSVFRNTRLMYFDLIILHS
jgi:GNAT superfamily N-acetyltransferase